MKKIEIIAAILILFLFNGADFHQKNPFEFRIRTITAGVTLVNISDTQSIVEAIKFLEGAKQVFVQKGYEVQTIRIATQNLHELISGKPDANTIEYLKAMDVLAAKHDVAFSIGEILANDQYDADLASWTARLVKETSNINFSIPIASVKNGIHKKSIKTAAQICKALSNSSEGGEANFRFTASANCPDGIPFFPAAFHKGINSFAIGLEYPNVITRVFKKSDWEHAEENLKKALEIEMKPIEELANNMQNSMGWKYDGIDTSPAPGLDASIGESIEALTKKPFGAVTTLRACAIITNVIKNLDIKTCGYSGLMLPVIEDKTLAKRASEGRYTVEELLLFSSVSGTGLDVIPISGSTPIETIEGIYQDVAALSLRYFNKALSARLFPIPGKEAGQVVEFSNPFLTSSIIMNLE